MGLPSWGRGKSIVKKAYNNRSRRKHLGNMAKPNPLCPPAVTRARGKKGDVDPSPDMTDKNKAAAGAKRKSDEENTPASKKKKTEDDAAPSPFEEEEEEEEEEAPPPKKKAFISQFWYDRDGNPGGEERLPKFIHMNWLGNIPDPRNVTWDNIHAAINVVVKGKNLQKQLFDEIHKIYLEAIDVYINIIDGLDDKFDTFDSAYLKLLDNNKKLKAQLAEKDETISKLLSNAKKSGDKKVLYFNERHAVDICNRLKNKEIWRIVFPSKKQMQKIIEKALKRTDWYNFYMENPEKRSALADTYGQSVQECFNDRRNNAGTTIKNAIKGLYTKIGLVLRLFLVVITSFMFFFLQNLWKPMEKSLGNTFLRLRRSWTYVLSRITLMTPTTRRS
jgi:hypothetical protein